MRASTVVSAILALISAFSALLLGWTWPSVIIVYISIGFGSLIPMAIVESMCSKDKRNTKEIESQISALREMREGNHDVPSNGLRRRKFDS